MLSLKNRLIVTLEKERSFFHILEQRYVPRLKGIFPVSHLLLSQKQELFVFWLDTFRHFILIFLFERNRIGEILYPK